MCNVTCKAFLVTGYPKSHRHFCLRAAIPLEMRIILGIAGQAQNDEPCFFDNPSLA